MNKRRIQNSGLDAVGAKLLKAGQLSGEEIDDIVSSPHLFDGVRTGIAAGVEKRVPQRRRLTWKPAAASMTAIAALIVSFPYFGQLNKPDNTAVTRSKDLTPVLKVDSDPVRQDFTSVAVESRQSEISRPKVIKTAYREYLRPTQPKARKAPVKSESEFYSLNYAGNVEDAVRGGHIVRVDMSRSSLFALGVDLPLENDSKFIKTDLIVGTDGVPRAIRFVD